jgi:hypothetical protein
MMTAAVALYAAHPAAAGVGSLQTPAVDREASEESFLSAYDHFLQNRLWNALDELDASIKHNVYFVDAYYLRSLALRRMGRDADATDAMARYLEVRRDDARAAIIMETMRSERAAIRKILSPLSAPPTLSFTSHTIRTFPGVQAYESLSLKGMDGLGKITATGETVVACDTLGDRVWIFDRAGGTPAAAADVTRPAAAVFLSPAEILIFQENGNVWKMSLDASNKPMLAPFGEFGFSVTDADVIDSTFLAAADRRGGLVRFAEMPSMRQTVTWRPPDVGGKLFEPVAASAFGPLLAVADRGGGRVYVLDSYTLATVDEFEVETPRDLAWGGAGELFVLNETGSLYARHPVGVASADVRLAADGMRDAWSAAWADDGIVAASVSGRNWWVGGTKPGREEAFGAVSLRDPWIEVDGSSETLMLKGSASSVFNEFIADRQPVTQVVWRGETRPSRLVSVKPADGGPARFYSPSGGVMPSGAPVVVADGIADVMSDIAGLSRSGGQMPGTLVLDSRISGSDEDVERLLTFLLRQGIRLDLWFTRRPATLPMCRVSRTTLGRTYYANDAKALPSRGGAEWTLMVPLPPDVTTFGYPSDTTLSVFAEVDAIRFADWIPVWPSMIKRIKTGEVVE